MAQTEPNNDGVLLYDPLFETPPDTVIRDTPGRGFWGRAPVKKAIFAIVMTLFVGSSIVLSFRSLTKDRFRYEETDGGIMLTEFVAGKTDSVLEVGPVFDKDGQVIPGKSVTSVRRFAVCGNDYTSVILIGSDVRDIPDIAFYNCTVLQAVIVDPANTRFRSVDGVLYRQESGKLTELMLYPAKNYLYRAMLALGEKEPADAAQAKEFIAGALQLDEKCGDWLSAQREDYPSREAFGLTEKERAALQAGLRCGIAPGVTRIGEMSFAECDNLFEVTIPDGVKEVASMAFYKCSELRGIELPDTLAVIGSDGFSYCEKLPDVFIPAGVREIGHHAFFGCDGTENVRMACDKNDPPVLGQDWLPKKRKLVLHDVPVIYGEKRRGS
ncbi:MAG: leucine-rich repeat domain-containing protein [Clostridia bacterium]|nr:leucine-rich repeat domain-containing protein [Clostridia bacterium]